MPLTAKGKEIHAAMVKQYGASEGERVFYASRNKGTIAGVDAVLAHCDAFDERLSREYSADSKKRARGK